MANSVYQEYTMDVKLGNYQMINAVQGEVNCRHIQVSFCRDNNPYILSGLYTTLNMIKSDGNVIFNNGTIIDQNNGLVDFLISSEMCTNAGTFSVFFKIYGSNPTSELKVTGFQLIVEPANSDTPIESSSEYTALQTLIASVTPAITACNAATTNANAATTAANDAAIFANHEGTLAKNVPYVGTDGYWYSWNSTTEMYEKTNSYASVNYATFDIDLVTGILYMNTADNYTGASFQINLNGELEAVI